MEQLTAHKKALLKVYHQHGVNKDYIAQLLKVSREQIDIELAAPQLPKPTKKYVPKLRTPTESDLIIIDRYVNQLHRMKDIARDLHVTRQAIYKILKCCGVDTTKAQRIERTCPVCGEKVLRRRGMARKTRHSYCSAECYAIYMETLGEDYKPSSYYAKKSREVVKAAWPEYDPQKGHTVHHINKDVTDFRLQNLEVYASQSDHLKHHRGNPEAQPIWKG